MSFNHYAKIKRILAAKEARWYVRRIDEPTSVKNFKGELRHFDHFYRIYAANGDPIPTVNSSNSNYLPRLWGWMLWTLLCARVK